MSWPKRSWEAVCWKIRFTDDEVAARVDVVHSVVIKGFLRDRRVSSYAQMC